MAMALIIAFSLIVAAGEQAKHPAPTCQSTNSCPDGRTGG